MAELSGEAAVRQEYLAFARGQATGVSPSHEALALAVADDAPVSALLASIPRGKQQPNLPFGVARHQGGPVGSPAELCAWVVERWDDVRTEVVFHTAVLGYVEPEGRRRFADVVRELPGHWIANEHPTLLEGLVAVPPTRPRTDGPEPFLTALDGIPVG